VKFSLEVKLKGHDTDYVVNDCVWNGTLLSV
jgi:hypothetical protein